MWTTVSPVPAQMCAGVSPVPAKSVGGASPVPVQGGAQSGRSLSWWGAGGVGVGGDRQRVGGAGMSATTGHPAEVVAHARQLVRRHPRRPRAGVPARTPRTLLAPSDV